MNQSNIKVISFATTQDVAAAPANGTHNISAVSAGLQIIIKTAEQSEAEASRFRAIRSPDRKEPFRLGDFPNEIFYNIVNRLSDVDIASLAQCNTGYHAALAKEVTKETMCFAAIQKCDLHQICRTTRLYTMQTLKAALTMLDSVHGLYALEEPARTGRIDIIRLLLPSVPAHHQSLSKIMVAAFNNDQLHIANLVYQRVPYWNLHRTFTDLCGLRDVKKAHAFLTTVCQERHRSSLASHALWKISTEHDPAMLTMLIIWTQKGFQWVTSIEAPTGLNMLTHFLFGGVKNFKGPREMANFVNAILLRWPRVWVNEVYEDYGTPLQLLARMGPSTPEFKELFLPGVEQHRIVEAYKRVFKIFVDAGADLGARDIRGMSHLHDAVVSGDKVAVQLLLDAGANCQAKNNAGFTPSNVIYGALGLEWRSECEIMVEWYDKDVIVIDD